MISKQEQQSQNFVLDSDSDGSYLADSIDEQVDNKSSSILLRADNFKMGNFAQVKGKPITKGLT